MQIMCTCIDSGGHCTSDVYDFVKPRENLRVFAIKGRGGLGVPLVGKHTRTNRANIALFPIGDDAGKETVLDRLRMIHEDDEGYCHFPRESEFGYDEDYFKGLTSEKRIIKYSMGKRRIEWKKKSGVRNEPLDIRKYATAALEIVAPDFALLAKMREPSKTSTAAPKPLRRVISKGIDA
jgi:phage terminase large subunit GpA-like protein